MSYNPCPIASNNSFESIRQGLWDNLQHDGFMAAVRSSDYIGMFCVKAAEGAMMVSPNRDNILVL